MIIEVTNAYTGLPVFISTDKIILVEEKRPEDGGYVVIYMQGEKEMPITEELADIRKLIKAAA